ncbi:hypothetical protein [Trinickia acidisoli]|uniref:hypothetical protein n=1 Tax=Trinickia acidisoli TaxID=2767482 RepID=UPI001A8E2DAB|nr:hypothetical protein [Trinickia acidisoli]
MSRSSSCAPSVKDVIHVIREKVGTLETVLRAGGMSAAEIDALSPEKKEHLQRGLDDAIEQAAQWYVKKGFSPDQVRCLAHRASKADGAHSFFKALTTNAVSSMAVNLAVLAFTIPLSFVVPVLPLIAISVALSFGFSWCYGMHAWAAGKTMAKRHDESCNSHGFKRTRFGHAVPPDTMGRALSREGIAECARTGTRLAASAPLMIITLVLSVLQTGTAILPILGAFLSPIAALFGPVSNGLQELVSHHLSKRDGRYTQANLFGVSWNREKGFSFDAGQAEDNSRRLHPSAGQRALGTMWRMFDFYRRDFSREVEKEKKRGIDGPKAKELLLGMTAGAVMGDAASAGASLLGGSIAPGVKAGGTVAAMLAAGMLHVGKRPLVEAALEECGTRPGVRTPVPMPAQRC